jgi:nucleoside-diphosphate-sugar epimerase
MKIFVAGATGAIGKRLVPALRARGYDVVGLTRSPDKSGVLRSAGAHPVVADALDRTAMIRALEQAKPDVVIDELTSLAGLRDFKHFDREFAMTNRLRTEGTDILLAAARSAGVQRFIAQSYAGGYETTGSVLKTESDPLDPHPPRKQQPTIDAVRHLEQAVLAEHTMTGIALRYGSLYGPGTNMALDGDMSVLVRARKVPIIGNGAGVWSFLHVDDAASATVAAIERAGAGVYNVCDDEPARVSEWLPEYARALGAKRQWHIPAWLGYLFVGEVGIALMTRIRGASNEKAKRELGWRPRYSTWRQGFWTGLGQAADAKPTVRRAG